MTAEEIRRYLTELSDELAKVDVKGEIALYGGAVMCLAYKTRPATKDVDAIFEPVREIRNASHRIAERHNLKLDWLNLAVKMFVVEHKREVLFELPHLVVTIPDPDYLLAMKVLALRPNTEDESDARFLIGKLGLTSRDEVLSVVKSYYPKKQVRDETVFWLDAQFV